MVNFDLKTPCDQCPFRTDVPSFHLGARRAQGIAETLKGGNTFQCHKTGDHNPQHCAGALIALKKDQGGFSGALAVACAAGWLNWRALDLESPVFDSLEKFVEDQVTPDFEPVLAEAEKLTR